MSTKKEEKWETLRKGVEEHGNGSNALNKKRRDYIYSLFVDLQKLGSFVDVIADNPNKLKYTFYNELRKDDAMKLMVFSFRYVEPDGKAGNVVCGNNFPAYLAPPYTVRISHHSDKTHAQVMEREARKRRKMVSKNSNLNLLG